jgi:hypothetical protein
MKTEKAKAAFRPMTVQLGIIVRDRSQCKGWDLGRAIVGNVGARRLSMLGILTNAAMG